MDREKIGSFIKQKRTEFGYSQKDLAELLHVTPQAISKWENGRGIPDIEIMKEMATVFKVNLDEISNGEEQNKVVEKRKIDYRLIGALLVCVLIVVFMFISKQQVNNNFEFLGVSSTNDSFTIKGIAAYSKEQKSLYISSIEYQDECHDLYTGYEFGIFEIDSDEEKPVSQVGDLNEPISDGEHLPILLKNVELKIDDFETDCSDLSNALEIVIKAKRIDGAIVSFKIPLEIGESCAISAN